jgi:hypothetical protein
MKPFASAVHEVRNKVTTTEELIMTSFRNKHSFSKVRTKPRLRLAVEALEDRLLPTGNVLATVVPSSLDSAKTLIGSMRVAVSQQEALERINETRSMISSSVATQAAHPATWSYTLRLLTQWPMGRIASRCWNCTSACHSTVST